MKCPIESGIPRAPRFDVVILVIVLAPVGGAVQPIGAATLKIDHSGEFVFFEIIRLMEGVLKIGIAAHSLDRAGFVDACALRSD